ncbi:related to f-box wd-repeat pof10 [Lecanosticta acicola]|uniref:Related to f-box wd-repeat pof10 n=1 Tax=Lecanosticta acicola TaxID=111012 RepID=A0AAI8YU48_9PEZI|nr:related to f-box wd-repeat pof10 [Lecanosticta acicola]
MHPEYPAISEQEDTENLTQRDPSPQHGLHDHHPLVSLSSAGSADAGTTTATSTDQLALDAALAASLQESDGPAQPNQDRRLSSRNTPSPPARNRIDEYEKASTPPVRRREGPAFEVIKKQRNPNDKRSPVLELPNEVLTHALAHLAPSDLASVSLVSKRLHGLVTGPHAWRTAFARYFPGPNSINPAHEDPDEETQTVVKSDRRAFARLTALASWRSEYIMRTRLLRSLSRGKPVQAPPTPQSPRSGHASNPAPIVMYNSQLFTTINHIHATFGTGLNKRLPRFIHGADDTGAATSSDPNLAKVDSWGLSDPHFFLQFAERFPGDDQYGLGPGELVGVPNPMDVSQPFGMVIGEGSPEGMTYYRSTEEMRGRFLPFSSVMSVPELGIPKILSSTEAITAVWIAKSAAIPSLTEGLIGILSGSSAGVLTAYSLGSINGGNNRDQRFGRGEMTARWVLSPGVPIIALAVDNEYSLKRQAQNRIWAVALNALGEVFYLTKFPKRPHVERGTRLDDESLERTAWLTGRTVYWNAIEPSRRVAKLDPYADATVDGSYSPRSSWNGMCLSKDQIQAETREVEAFAQRKPKDFQKTCSGWDMRRKLEVDFAGDDGSNAGENLVVFECGLEEDGMSAVKRYSRTRFHEKAAADSTSTPPLTTGSTEPASPPSLFGAAASPALSPASGPSFERLEDSLAQDDLTGSITPRPMTEEWRTSVYSLGGLKQVQIMATAIDKSAFATLTTSEDPLLGFTGQSASSSPSLTPLPGKNSSMSPSDVPGQRARLFAAGTMLGSVLLWDIRAPVSRSVESVNTVEPVRIIHTDSPQISCLALSSLYLVHGGNDGLVQAWDPLASDTSPIRTLNSRFSSRARRRLVQAQASPQGVGINLFAAGAICLDPDSTVLRGMVSLGTHLRYWSYSSSAADQYKSSKRKLRRSERGSNNGGERFSGAVRSNLKDYIANERFELDREKEQRKKESQRFAGRFGTELLGGSEEEMMAYAAMLSQETLEQENMRRQSDVSAGTGTVASSVDPTPADSPSPRLPTPKTDDELDADIAEAIRQSLATSPATGYDIPIRHAKPKHRKGSSARASPRVSPFLAGSSKPNNEMADLDFALQLSLAEEQSKQSAGADAFPSLPASRGTNAKGKGRGG